jgi:BNR repeat-like domain
MASGHRGSTVARQACAVCSPSICRAHHSAARSKRPTQTTADGRQGSPLWPMRCSIPNSRRWGRDFRALQERLWSDQWRYVRASRRFSGKTRSLPAGASAHASTIAETAEGVVAAWFGGPREGHPDVGIRLARKAAAQWSAPVEVARGADRRGRPQPRWNPVLHQAVRGPLLLFYKVGPSPRRWWDMLSTSAGGGRTWGAARRLPRSPRPDQEQTGRTWRRFPALSVQHRASGLAHSSRAHCGPV